MANPIPPNSVIGIFGGGQLGRMTAAAAAHLGYQTCVFCDSDDEPAAQIATHLVLADYDDEEALQTFAEICDVVTLEFENVPVAALDVIEKTIPVRPNRKVLEVTQARLMEKDFARKNGFQTAPYAAVKSVADLEKAVAEIGAPAVLKTNRFGYDGKGQVKINADTNLAEAWESLQTDEAILEGFITFEKEVSIIIARNPSGDVKFFPVTENKHENHILSESIVPTQVDAAQLENVHTSLKKLAEDMDLCGLLAIEFFVCKNGEFLLNEMAPRPHNSGHWTMDGCVTSQFEQLVRAVCDLPLGDTNPHGRAVMKNILGPDDQDWEKILQDGQAKLHLYGKLESKPGRKMGHINFVMPAE